LFIFIFILTLTQKSIFITSGELLIAFNNVVRKY